MDNTEPLPAKAWGVCLGLTLLTFIVFLPLVYCGFIDFDDPWYVSNNPHVLGGLTFANIKWAFSNVDVGYWQPLSWLSLMLDVNLRGPDAEGFHLTNLLLHAFSAGLVFLVLCRMTGTVWRAALVAAIYALHPLRVESVGWIVERKDVLSNLLAWFTIAGYVHYSREPSHRRYLLVIVPFILGIFAKPMIVTLPCLLLLLDYWPLRRLDLSPRRNAVTEDRLEKKQSFAARTPMELVVEKIPLFLLALAAGAVTLLGQGKARALVPLSRYPLGARLGNVVVGYALYLWKMVWFSDLSIFYPLPASMPWLKILAAASALAAISALVWFERNRRPWLVVGWLWFLGVMAPVSGIFQSGPQLLADRFSYLPSVGLIIMIVWSIPSSRFAGKSIAGRWLRGTLAAVGLVSLCVATWTQTFYWQDTRTLFGRALEITSDNWLAHDQMGLVRFREKNYSAAMEECRQAIAIYPEDSVANDNLGIVLSKLGRDQEAIPYFRVAQRTRPEYAEVCTNLGVSLQHTGDIMGAYQQYKAALELDPNYEPGHSDMGGLLGQIGMADKAVAELKLALSLKPDDQAVVKKLAGAEAMLRESAKGKGEGKALTPSGPAAPTARLETGM